MTKHTSRAAARNRAILLLGPTGSGKTPLGELIQQRGFGNICRGRLETTRPSPCNETAMKSSTVRRSRCSHFDFGENLRQIVEQNRPDELITQADIDFLRQVLHHGALLEKEHAALAEGILRSCLAKHGADQQTIGVLNGLPRHVEQARLIESILEVQVVVYLRCSDETVCRRVRTNIGGDRTDRQDDDPESVRNKLAIFRQRSASLLDHYAQQGARIETVDVTAQMTPEQVWRILDQRQCVW